ncbi:MULTISPECIES: chemotaxis protein CheW [unclassified Leptolyngbya]|uniref:chemotaxis protein CheW n=1 Tax=unclassified Leptolyngbya TaxID=2650499 RepID=UPI001684C87A|nr:MULTISPECIES: chemotaxis protein CheW [unclassified Leptolyngbya]MBD1911459.1 purine-binding chemotaxis protein CheW [Leptolyngbya sp. FACHB-8]MBD2153471.1 purine-binding chemotaxis protein CheW [Leptolyngbya sp. FACHB-16]
MADTSYLIFDSGQNRYGLAATAVQELFFLPEVTPLPNLPRCVVGVIDLRGEILPILDLGLFLGQGSRPYTLTNSVIVLRNDRQALGLVVEHTHEVEAIAPSYITPWATTEVDSDRPPAFLGIAKRAGEIVTILNPTAFTAITMQAILGTNLEEQWQAAEATTELLSDPWAELSKDERQVLRQRRNGLAQALQLEDSQSLTALAVMGLQGEYFGLGLDTIHEFTDIHAITPIPCCPPHVLGNINLRGEIVTLVDISPVINLTSKNQHPWQKAIVVRMDDIVAGIAVEDIFDVVHVHPGQINTAPIATQGNHNDYLQGVAPYQNTLMSVINLSKILTSGVLDVDEEV